MFRQFALQLVLGICLFGFASAQAASTDFNITGAVSDGSTVSGTLSIDTTAGMVTASTVALGAPDSVTCPNISYQFSGGSTGWVLGLDCIPGGSLLQLVLLTPTQPGGSLIGYAGGGINSAQPNFSFYSIPDIPSRPVTGNVAPALVAATIAKSFSPSTIAIGATSTLTFTIGNPNALALQNVAFSDTLPAGLSYAPGTLVNNCGPAVSNLTTTALDITISSLAPGTTCTLSVTVNGNTTGAKVNTTSTITATGAPDGNPATATLTVVFPPSISKGFTDSQIELFFGSTTLSFKIINPNAATTLTNVSFTDTLPAGLTVSAPSNGLSGSCGGGTITAVPGSSSISLSGSTLAAGASCTFSVNVLGAQIGSWTNTTSTVSADPGLVGNAASASITVVATQFMWFFETSSGAAQSQ